MITFAIYCDATPGQEAELDRLLTGPVKTFWLKQSGVNEFRILRDKLVGYPERSIRIDVKDFATLQKVLDSPQWGEHRQTMMSLVSRVQIQILEPVS